jgi:CrcB protein
MPVSLAVALFGALGALARYGVTRAIEARSVSVFPWATLLVNVTGCFLVALAVASLVDRPGMPGWLRIGLVVGFAGGYTTLTALALDTYELGVGGELDVAFANVVASAGLGLAAIAAGTLLGRQL